MTETLFDLSGKRLWVAGHRGMVGGAICRRLETEDCEILTVNRDDVDLTRQADVEAWIGANKPDGIFLAAARVGGILANDTYPAEFLRDNLVIQTNIIHSAWQADVSKLMLLGSSCIYPKFAPQPMREEDLLSGRLEPTNEWYAIAKIAGIKMCQAYRRQYGCNFISAQPTNLYGMGDNFDLNSSHVIPALMAKAHNSKQHGDPFLEVWGSGTPKREFLYVEDLADALIFLMKNYSGDMQINVGSGQEYTIAEVAQNVAQAVKYDGQLKFDSSKPDGTPRKLLDTSRLDELGWRATMPLQEGLQRTYAWYLSHAEQ